MSQMIGCYLQCGTLQVGQTHTIEGPLFTVGKRSQNGDRIPPAEAERLKQTLIGSPIRYCPAGVSKDGVVAEHYCDLIKDNSSVIGSISSVSTKTDSAGREIVYASGTLKPGVDANSLPKGWSLFSKYEQRDDDDNIYGTDEPSITVLNHPAFDEAVTKTYVVSASGAKSPNSSPNFSSINTGEGNKEGEATMADDKVTPNPAPTPAPAAEPIKAPEAAKPADTLSRADVEKLLNDERKRVIEETKETLARERFASELAEKKVSLNLIKGEDKQSQFESLMKYSSNDLQVMLTEFDQLSKLAKAQAKSEGIKGSDLKGATNPVEIPELQNDKFNKILSKLNITPDIYKEQVNKHRF